MRSTITLNGKNSSEIAGLLIQTLPPISKPLMRTQIEEIDGRDGDIVTKLGFSAYKKEFTIGLYGDYDVDQVIGYFNSEGTVIFSNEPDKYYYYQIVDQIDFEKLIRFKTATVTMHCQPFKYSTTEAPAVFENVDNLVSIPDFTKTTNGITVNVEDGVISVNGTGSAATEFYIPIASLSLTAGDYVMRALGSGTSPEACSV
jgi:predicted phage tail component-like protein